MEYYKNTKSFENRRGESRKIMEKYPDRVAIIVEKLNNKTTLPDLDKSKYLVPHDITSAQFIFIIRKRLKLNSIEAIYISTDDYKIIGGQKLISQIYQTYKDDDGFLYLKYTQENTFGKN